MDSELFIASFAIDFFHNLQPRKIGSKIALCSQTKLLNLTLIFVIFINGNVLQRLIPYIALENAEFGLKRGQSFALLRPGHSRYTVACCCPYCKCSKRDNAQSKQITSTALDFSLPYKRFGCLVMTFLKNHHVETMHTLEHCIIGTLAH